MKRERLQILENWLTEEKIKVAFIHSRENVFYLTGYDTDPHERLMGLFVFPEGETIFILPKMEVPQLKATNFNGEIIGYADNENPWDLLKVSLHKRNVEDANMICVEKDLLSISRGEQLAQLFPNAAFQSVEQKLNEMRVIKDEEEIEILKEAAKLADYGVEVGISALKEGCTELEVLATIEYELKKKGVRDMSFSTMVLFGENAGNPHGIPGERKLQKGDFVLFDLGVVLNGYCSDITRTVVYKEVSDKQKEIYDVVLKAELEALNISREGVRIGDLDKIARSIITNAGYGEYFPHRLGHGLGINVHEYPSMSDDNDNILKEGMVYTIEPGIYVPHIGGVRIEDDVVITKDGAETLTKFPKALQIIS
ncbi:Xaa-Pro peptidase family protein [Bacillus sp. FJAT-47783]|uniref:M24 family metallopeptidase n=1 Tax=Bacillus sp. FJAT-47783 TaxID=2922712 RepID=UPI001FAC83EA|nr:Xaa-Pro peptidase family protein [Bacillus sp. FJAT-47783]